MNLTLPPVASFSIILEEEEEECRSLKDQISQMQEIVGVIRLVKDRTQSLRPVEDQVSHTGESDLIKQVLMPKPPYTELLHDDSLKGL